jgi:hypothetical protein
MISKALPRVEAGNDLNSNSPILSEIWGREVLGMFATMPHESWPNRLCPTIGSNSHLSDLRSKMKDLDELQRIRNELIHRQSMNRFDRVLSTRLTVDYNRLTGVCPN